MRLASALSLGIVRSGPLGGGGGPSGITIVASGSIGGAGPTNVTTLAADTRGANLIVVSVSSGGDPGLTDSKSNAWVSLTLRHNAGGFFLRIFYCINPIVGTGHTFTTTGASYASVGYVAARGVGYLDQQSGFDFAGPVPSITPAVDGSLLVTSSCGLATGVSITDDFTADAVDYLAANHFNGGVAYLIQGTAAAVGPTWNPEADHRATGMASFVPTPAVPTSSTKLVVCLGDSMTMGFGTNSGALQPDGSIYPDSYPNQLRGLLGAGWDTNNLGVGGYTSEQVVWYQLGPANARYRPNASQNIAVVMEMINSIVNGGDTPAQAYASNAAAVASLKAKGYAVVLVSAPGYATGPGGTPQTGWPAKQAACDALVAANTAGADAMIYPSAIPGLEDGTDPDDVADGLHYTASGYLKLATPIAAAIAGL